MDTLIHVILMIAHAVPLVGGYFLGRVIYNAIRQTMKDEPL